MQLQMNMLTTFNTTDNTLICEGCNTGVYITYYSTKHALQIEQLLKKVVKPT